jgi:catecholate siderophore receptor
VLNPPNFLPFGNATVTGNPSVIPVDTKSLFALETANYRDFLIFTAGLRFDNYNISASKNGFPTVSAQSNMVNYNLGLVVKPLPTASVYAAYGTSSNPVGAELDGTSANYGGLQLTNASINQIFGPVEAKAVEVGTKWEFFNRHLLATGRCSVPTSAMRANSFQRGFRMPGRSRPAPPITCRASISEPRARSWTSSASLAASC